MIYTLQATPDEVRSYKTWARNTCRTPGDRVFRHKPLTQEQRDNLQVSNSLFWPYICHGDLSSFHYCVGMGWLYYLTAWSLEDTPPT